MPYKGDEELYCPLCKKQLTFIPDIRGFFCPDCDGKGITHVSHRGGKPVTQRIADALQGVK